MTIRLLRLTVTALVVMLTASCTHPPDLVGIDNPEIPALAIQGAARQKIYIATTREASEVAGVFFSGERAPRLGFASVTVSIPPNHKPGNIEWPRDLPPDPRREFAVVDPTVYDTGNVFVSQLKRELASRPPEDRRILLFVHGYNNTMSESILRMAQFAEDTGFEGVPVLFSWASAARVARYVYDLNSVMIARPQLIEATHFLSQAGAESYDVFAHSMGGFLLMESAVLARDLPRDHMRLHTANVMLAAPDIDIDLFRAQLEAIDDDREPPLFVFVSKDDSALRFSQRISGGVTRVGRADAETLAELGVNVIDITEIDDSSSGSHSKFAGSPEIVQLIGNGLKSDKFDDSPGIPTLIELLDGVPILHVLAP